MTFTKEQLIEQASHNLRIMNSQSGEQQSNEAFMADLQLMEIAMASLTAEPMAYMHRSGQVVTRDECSDEEVFALCCKVDAPLYTSPQPLTTSERAELDNYRNAQQVVPEWTNEQCLEFLSIAFRHAEIKGDLEMDDIRLGVKMVNACRAAMLQGGKL